MVVKIMKRQKYIYIMVLVATALLITSTSSIASFNMLNDNISDISVDDETVGVQSVKKSNGGHRLSIQCEKTDRSSSSFQTNTLESSLFSASNSNDWWKTDWLYRKEIQVDSSKIDANLNDFPMLLSITDSDLKNHARNDGSDIVFINENDDELNHEIEYYNASSGELIVWVKTDLSATENTVLYMYYGNPYASSLENPTDVWNSGYVMVQHLNETSGVHYDSTVYNNDGEWNDLNDNGSQDAIGRMDGADRFDGIDDYIDCGNDDSLNSITEEITIEIWVKYQDGENKTRIVDKYPSFMVYINTSTDKLAWNGYINNSLRDIQFPNTDIIKDTWTHIVVTYANDTEHAVKTYVNGLLKDRLTDYNGSLRTTVDHLLIGNDLSMNNSFNGTIDEVRISNVALNESQVKTVYDNQNVPSSFIIVASEETYTGIYNASGRIGNETHPAIARDLAGNLFGAYEDDNVSKIIWTSSSASDDGKRWDSSFSLDEVDGFEQYPTVDYWGSSSKFFGTFVTPRENASGAAVYLVDNRGSYDYWNWADEGWYNMTDVDIACDNSQNNWEFGVISLVISTTYKDDDGDYSVSNGPHMFYMDPDKEENYDWINWEPDYPNCSHTKVDIDHITKMAYAVYDRYNENIWKLLIRVLDFEGLNHNETFEIKGAGNLTCPAVATYNDNLVIIMEADEKGNKDIICKYSDNGANDGNLETSVVVNSTDDESYPEISWVNGSTFVCTFTKNGNLYRCISKDGGKTWSDPEQINDVDGTVVDEYKNVDLSDHGFKCMWEDNRGDDIDVYIGNTGVTAMPQPISTIKGYVKNEYEEDLEEIDIEVSNDWNWKSSTETNEDGYFEIKVVPGLLNISAELSGFHTKSLDINVLWETIHWWNITLISKNATLEIGPISGGFGVSAFIFNKGKGYAHDVTWNITIEGERKTWEPEGGHQDKLEGESSIIAESGILFGYGPIKITITVTADEIKGSITLSANRFLLGFWVSYEKFINPFKKVKVSGTVINSETGTSLPGVKVTAKLENGRLRKMDRTGVIFNKGEYKLKLRPGTYNITATKMGFQRQTKIIIINPDSSPVTLNFSLDPVNLSEKDNLKEIIYNRFINKCKFVIETRGIFNKRFS